MPHFVVLLRGVNVGKARRVPMADFRQVLLGLGCTRVTTLLNSGNAVVEHGRISPDALARRTAKALAVCFGFEVPVVVKSAAQFQALVDAAPVPPDTGQHARVLAVFAQQAPALAALAPLAERVVPPQTLWQGAEGGVLHCPGGILDSAAAAALLGPMGRSVTTRNWATVLKIQALLEA